MITIYKDDSNNNQDFTLIEFFKLMGGHKFKNFNELKLRAPRITNEFNFEITSSLSNNSEIELFKKFLKILPFYFFAKINRAERISIKNIIKKNKKKFKNDDELIKLIDFDFDVEFLIQFLEEINNQGFQFNYLNIVTELYNALLEYSFLTLSNTILIKSQDTLYDIVKEYSKTIKNDRTTSSKDEIFLDYFHNTISNVNEKTEYYFKNIELFSNSKHFSKILFSKIYFNLNLTELSNRKRNKILRPIYFNMICKPIRHELYQIGEDDPIITRNLNDTINNLEQTPYKKK